MTKIFKGTIRAISQRFNLKALINKGKIVSRAAIMEYLWDSSMFVNDNTLTVNITRIRNKIEEIGLKDFIKTKRGQGYII